MTGREIQKRVRQHLLPVMGGYAAKGREVFMTPVEYLVRGFSFEPSAFSKCQFTVYAYVQPLYTGESSIGFTFGERLGALARGPDRWWTISEDNEAEVMAEVLALIKRYGEPFVDTWKTPEDFVTRAGARHSDPEDPYVLQAAFYSAVLVNATKAIEPLHQQLKESTVIRPGQLDLEWPKAMARQADLLLDTYLQGHAGAKRLLHQWRAVTLEALRLTEYAAELPLDK
jgi:hypothetical protein